MLMSAQVLLQQVLLQVSWCRRPAERRLEPARL
jgi:hypothetical protein